MKRSWMTVAELATEAGVHADTIRAFCRTGRISASKWGRDWVITVPAARKFLDAYEPYDTLRKRP